MRSSLRIFIDILIVALLFSLGNITLAADWKELQQQAHSVWINGDYLEATRLSREALATAEQMDSIEPAILLPLLTDLAILYKAQNRFAEAEPLLERSLTISRTINGSKHSRTAEIASSLINVYERQGKQEQADILNETMNSQWNKESIAENNIAQGQKTTPKEYDFSRLHALLSYGTSDISQMDDDTIRRYGLDLKTEIDAMAAQDKDKFRIDPALHQKIAERLALLMRTAKERERNYAGKKAQLDKELADMKERHARDLREIERNAGR